MSIIVVILRVLIVLLGLVALAAGLNSLPFPGIGIFITTLGLSLFLWGMTNILKSSPKTMSLEGSFLKYSQWLFYAGFIVVVLGELFT